MTAVFLHEVVHQAKQDKINKNRYVRIVQQKTLAPLVFWEPLFLERARSEIFLETTAGTKLEDTKVLQIECLFNGMYTVV